MQIFRAINDRVQNYKICSGVTTEAPGVALKLTEESHLFPSCLGFPSPRRNEGVVPGDESTEGTKDSQDV